MRTPPAMVKEKPDGLSSLVEQVTLAGKFSVLKAQNATDDAQERLFLHEFAEGRGRLILFFPDEQSSAETRFRFEEFVLAHAKRRALDGTVEGFSLKGCRRHANAL